MAESMNHSTAGHQLVDHGKYPAKQSVCVGMMHHFLQFPSQNRYFAINLQQNNFFCFVKLTI